MKQTILSKTASGLNAPHQTINKQNSVERLRKDINNNNNSTQYLETYAAGMSAFESVYPKPKISNQQFNAFSGAQQRIQPTILHHDSSLIIDCMTPNDNAMSNQGNMGKSFGSSHQVGKVKPIIVGRQQALIKNGAMQRPLTSSVRGSQVRFALQGSTEQLKQFTPLNTMSNHRKRLRSGHASGSIDLSFQTHQLKVQQPQALEMEEMDKQRLLQKYPIIGSGGDELSQQLDNKSEGKRKLSQAQQQMNGPLTMNNLNNYNSGGSLIASMNRQKSNITFNRSSVSFANQKLYKIDHDASVVVLTSKIANEEIITSPTNIQLKSISINKSPGSGGSGGIEQLSTDETEVRHQVELIEKNVQERAFNRYSRMVNSVNGKEDLLKKARQVNDVTQRYRIQNGGTLTQIKSQRFPNEVKVNSVSGLDMTPLVSEKDLLIKFEKFEINFLQPQPDKVRANFPELGSGANYCQTQKSMNIIHDNQLWENFTKAPTRFQFGNQFKQPGPRTTTASLQVSPTKLKMNEANQSARKMNSSLNNEIQLSKKMEEAKRKYFKDEKLVVNEESNNQNSKVLNLVSNGSKHPRDRMFSLEEKQNIQQELKKDDKFVRNDVQSNRLRTFSKDNQAPSDLQKWGFDKTNQLTNQNSNFDPLRLKILVMPYHDANPVGKNADYFFLKGFKCAIAEEFANAMASYLKGLSIKNNHLLCRFNLGVILFKLGLFDEAISQYNILAKQGYGERTVVLYNKALCELQTGRFHLAIDSCQKCITIITDSWKINATKQPQAPASNSGQSPLNNTKGLNKVSSTALVGNKKLQSGMNQSDIEMVADMHVVQGLCNMRTNNLKRAGKCFDEAKQFKVQKKSELLLLVERCLFKMIQTRVMEYFRTNVKSQQQLIHELDEDQNHFSGQQILRKIKNKSQQTRGLQGNASRLSKTRNISQSVVKIYLTDIDIQAQYLPESDYFGIKANKSGIKVIDELQHTTNFQKKKMNRSKSHSILKTKQIFQEIFDQDKINQDQQLRTKEQNISIPLQQIKPSLDEMTSPQVFDLFKTILGKKADPEHCYLYVDDDRTVRLDKLLDLPNSFEQKRSQPTEKERNEKLKRESIVMFYNQITTPEKLMPTKIDQNSSRQYDEEQNNFLLANFFKLKDRLTEGIPDKKKEDNEKFQDFLSQIRKFNAKLDLSLNYFLGLQPAATDQDENRRQKGNKFNGDVEIGIKMMKEMIVEQAKKQQPEITMNRLKLDEIASLEQELSKIEDRDIEKIEALLMKLKAFKYLNPQLRQLVIKRSTCRRYGKNQMIYQQGTEGLDYYFLLRGSVSLLANKADFGNFELFIRSYYDGDCFGEQPQLFAKQESQVASDEQIKKLSIRDASCFTNDDCLVLEVSNSVKHEFYRTDSSNQYEKCLYWLRKNPVFKLTEGFYLLQMIFNIEKRIYNLGEALVRSGDVPEGMFIVTSGQCKAVYESVGIKEIESGEFSRFQKQPNRFNCGNAKLKSIESATPINSKNKKEQYQKHEESLNRFNSDNSVFNQLKGDGRKSFQSTRIFLDDVGRHMPNHIAFNNNINYANLVPGDSFGSRVLLPDDEIMKRLKPNDLDIKMSETIQGTKANSHLLDPNVPIFNRSSLELYRKTVSNMKSSALSIIADSKEVEVLILKTTILSYLPEPEKDKIYEDIIKVCDPDKPSSLSEIMRFKGENTKWEGFRVKLVKDIRKVQYMDRHKGVYKR